MSNYKLTDDLIQDCMSLIPQNLERLNEKSYFIFEHDEQRGVSITSWQITAREIKGSEEIEKFLIISHCLRKIPEFQAENPKYQEPDYESLETEDYNVFEIAESIEIACLPKTIASATLHGMEWKVVDGVKQLVMMDEPPRTLKELCESYKNVMSEQQMLLNFTIPERDYPVEVVKQNDQYFFYDRKKKEVIKAVDKQTMSLIGGNMNLIRDLNKRGRPFGTIKGRKQYQQIQIDSDLFKKLDEIKQKEGYKSWNEFVSDKLLVDTN